MGKNTGWRLLNKKKRGILQTLFQLDDVRAEQMGAGFLPRLPQRRAQEQPWRTKSCFCECSMPADSAFLAQIKTSISEINPV